MFGRENRKHGTCGLCGFRGKLTKTHVPPKSAGNGGRVRRFHVVSDSNRLTSSSARRIGGIHVFGLCPTCNSTAAQWDEAYATMAKALWGLATDTRIILPSNRVQMSETKIQPGAVSRSALLGCFALNPLLRELHEETADQIMNQADAVELAPGTNLFLAATRGPQAIVTGGMSGFNPLRPNRPDLFSWAQVYFPPLAWQLAIAEKSSLLAEQGWADVSEWLAQSPQEQATLASLVQDLPLVLHPRQDPEVADEWVELLTSEICFVVMSDNAIRSQWIDSSA